LDCNAACSQRAASAGRASGVELLAVGALRTPAGPQG
jgi:hypothetical protein